VTDSRHQDIITEVYGPAALTPLDEDSTDESLLTLIQQCADLESATAQRSGNTASYAEKLAILNILRAGEERAKYQGHFAYFPSEGPLRAELYKKHMQFFDAGMLHRERIFMAANRVGKSISGGYEMTCHLTGMYPKWWTGRRFLDPTDAWAAGDTSQTTRDIVQRVLMGEVSDFGSGMIPHELMEEIRMRPGVPGGVDSLKIKHTSGGYSNLGFKSFDQKRRAFQGTSKHVIWLDEEPPYEVYGECLIRTMTTHGLVYVTFTPLQGLTAFVTEFQKAIMSQELEAGNV